MTTNLARRAPARALVIAELQGRDLLRRRAVMALFVLLPAAFYYSVPASEPYGLVAGSMGVSWAVSAAGMFGVLGWRRVEPRLALSGARVLPALTGRLVLITGLALVLVAGFAPQIVWRSRDLIADPAVFVLGLALMGLVSVPIGLAIGALVPRELEGTLVLIGVIGIGTSVPPDTSLARALPLWGPLEVMQIGAGLSDGAVSGGAWHSLATIAVLLTVATAALRRRTRIAAIDPTPHEEVPVTATDRPTRPPIEAAAPTGDRFVATGLLLLAVILVAYQLIARAVIPPLAVFAAVFAGIGVLVWQRHARWRLAVAGGLALVYLVGSVRFFVANLAHPASPASFLAEAFLLITLLTVVAGVVGGWRGATPGRRRPLAIGAVALAGAAVVVSTVAALSVDSDALHPGDVPVEALRSAFPASVTVPADAPALWVDNQDPFHHTLLIDGTDVRAVLPASTSVRVPIDLAPGSYRYWCDVPGHETMEGTLDVR